MELHALNSGRKPRVVTAMTMLKQYLFQYVLSHYNCKSLPITHALYVCEGIKGKLVLLSFLVVLIRLGHTFSRLHRTEVLISYRM